MKSLSEYSHSLLKLYYSMCQFGPLGRRHWDKFRVQNDKPRRMKEKMQRKQKWAQQVLSYGADTIPLKGKRTESRNGQSKPQTKMQIWQKLGQPYVHFLSKYYPLRASHVGQELPDPSAPPRSVFRCDSRRRKCPGLESSVGFWSH